jgi:hypothetical protein
LLEKPESPATRPVHWPTLPADEAGERWHELGDWVADILVDWYELTRGRLPDCWPRHRPAVVELSWLRTCYAQAYSENADAHLAAEWNTRWRRAALDNIAAAISKDWCRPGQHLHHEFANAQQRNGVGPPSAR